MQLSFTDDQVASFMEELVALIEGHLAILDAASRSHLYKVYQIKNHSLSLGPLIHT